MFFSPLSSLGLQGFLFTLCAVLFSFLIPSDAQVYPNVTSGFPIKVVLLSLSHLSISLCAISCCLAQFDVHDSDSSFPVPDLELGKCPGGIQWCSATKIWFLELLVLRNYYYYLIFSGNRDKICGFFFKHY